MIYVQPEAREGLTAYLATHPRSVDAAELSIHDIPDGSETTVVEIYDSDDQDQDQDQDLSNTAPLRVWPDNNGVNILGTPSGSTAFMHAYLDSKLNRHRFLLFFIEDVATAGYSREATTMLSGSVAPRMTHILKSIPKIEDTSAWMLATDEAYRSNSLRCLTNSMKLEEAFAYEELGLLTETLDLPPQLGGAGLQPLELSADEEFLGS